MCVGKYRLLSEWDTHADVTRIFSVLKKADKQKNRTKKGHTYIKKAPHFKTLCSTLIHTINLLKVWTQIIA